jgi:hypothetical protein
MAIQILRREDFLTFELNRQVRLYPGNGIKYRGGNICSKFQSHETKKKN